MSERHDETNPAGVQPGGVGELAAGEEFAGHRVESEVGRGGMGVVYRARHLALDRERALKVIAPGLSADPTFRERFKRESRLAASVEHPNVIPVHHAGEERGALYLSMRLVEGPDLRRLVAADGPLSLERAARLITGVAAGLDAAHARGLLHRDVKPANILVEPGGEGEHVFLTDFGISRVAGPGGTLTSSGDFLGSADYVAPEQIEGNDSDQRVDVYALGCVIHFALTGQPPFPRDNDLAKLFAHANASRPRPSEVVDGVHAAVDAVVARATAIRPEDRYASAGEAADDLERIAKGTAPVAPLRRPRAEEAPTGRIRSGGGRRRRAGAWVGLAALIAAGVAAAVVFTGGDGDAGTSGDATPASPGTAPKTVATVDVGRNPVALTVGEGAVWVAAHRADALDAISPARAKLSQSLALPGPPASVAVGFGSLWVVNGGGNTVFRVEPGQGTTSTSIPVGTDPSDVVVDKRWVWVTNEGSNSVSRIDPDTNQVDDTIPVGEAPRSVATGAGRVWVANIGGSSVTEINPQLARVTGKPIAVGERPNDLTVGAGSLWVIDVFNGTLTQIDPGTAKVIGKPIEVGARPRGVKTGFGYVWVANGGDGTVTRVDPETAEPAGSPTKVGNDPSDLAVGAGAVWTSNFDDSTVTKVRP